jgi:hypothetical protein
MFRPRPQRRQRQTKQRLPLAQQCAVTAPNGDAITTLAWTFDSWTAGQFLINVTVPSGKTVVLRAADCRNQNKGTTARDVTMIDGLITYFFVAAHDPGDTIIIDEALVGSGIQSLRVVAPGSHVLA